MSNLELSNLIKACEYLRDNAGYNKELYQHQISNQVFSAFCRQLFFAKRGLEKK